MCIFPSNTSQMTNWAVDMTLRPGGDGGVDFTCRNGTTIDLKSARSAVWLPREVDKDFASILVMAEVRLVKRTCQFKGWEYDEEMVKQRIGTLGKYTIRNHLMRVEKLRPMRDLVDIINE